VWYLVRKEEVKSPTEEVTHAGFQDEVTFLSGSI
jgi:hypothetical protein